MTPGELAIYEHVVDKNAHYVKLNAKILVTREVLDCVGTSIRKELKEIESDVWRFIALRLDPSVRKFVFRTGSGSLFCSVLNDICCFLQYATSSMGYWDIDPLNGNGVTITYEALYVQLGISKDVAKRCIESLLQSGKIERKRGMGGYRYCADPGAILEKSLEDPGEWMPVRFDPEDFTYVEDTELLDLITGVYGHTAAIQQSYLDVLRNQQREVQG